MKKLLIPFILAALLSGQAIAQSSAASPGTAAASLADAPAEGPHYLVRSALGIDRSAKLLARLEASWGYFNKVFRFEESRLPGKLVVREFATKADFDAYLLQVAGETRGDFVYLHYPSPQKRELLLFPKDDPDFSSSFVHQAFVQFLKAFIQEPPLWMRDGFAVFFETLAWSEASGTYSFVENLGWLETVKSLKGRDGLIALDRLLTAGVEDARSAVEVFYPEAWAFVSFLGNDPSGDYTRLLWETIATLGVDASLADNQAAFQKRLADWYGMDAATTAFLGYIDARKTFPELIASGIDRYGKKDYEAAGKDFTAAAALDPASFVPPYYLGLIAYARSQYAEADTLYRQSIDLGCDVATATYAIGLNAIARGLNDDGAATLAQAAAANPDKYRAKVEDILKRLGK
jgi:tetratricopeptide (TPR) repeat protein